MGPRGRGMARHGEVRLRPRSERSWPRDSRPLRRCLEALLNGTSATQTATTEGSSWPELRATWQTYPAYGS
eukprot:1603428-Amphidinium_carterae.1